MFSVSWYASEIGAEFCQCGRLCGVIIQGPLTCWRFLVLIHKLMLARRKPPCGFRARVMLVELGFLRSRYAVSKTESTVRCQCSFASDTQLDYINVLPIIQTGKLNLHWSWAAMVIDWVLFTNLLYIFFLQIWFYFYLNGLCIDDSFFIQKFAFGNITILRSDNSVFTDEKRDQSKITWHLLNIKLRSPGGWLISESWLPYVFE